MSLVIQGVSLCQLFLGLVNLCLKLLSRLFLWMKCEMLFFLSPFKAPGSDGIQPIFFQTYWDFVGNDVWEMVAHSFSSSNIDLALVETFIIPIPKGDNVYS